MWRIPFSFYTAACRAEQWAEEEHMLKILFVCLGNICRSPMGEFIFRGLVEKEGLAELFFIRSAGTSSEEEGNPVYPPARRELARHGIDCEGKCARQMERADYGRYDYILGMESRNVAGILRISGGDPDKKVFRLLDFSARPRDIADPWYSGDFIKTFEDISEGASCFLEYLRREGKV